MKKALFTLLVLSLMGTSVFAQTADTIAASTHKRYTFGDFFDSSLKFDVLKLHNKLNCIASTVAAEAVPQVLVR